MTAFKDNVGRFPSLGEDTSRYIREYRLKGRGRGIQNCDDITAAAFVLADQGLLPITKPVVI